MLTDLINTLPKEVKDQLSDSAVDAVLEFLAENYMGIINPTTGGQDSISAIPALALLAQTLQAVALHVALESSEEMDVDELREKVTYYVADTIDRIFRANAAGLRQACRAERLEDKLESGRVDDHDLLASVYAELKQGETEH